MRSVASVSPRLASFFVTASVFVACSSSSPTSETPLTYTPDTFFERDVDVLMAREPKSQVVAVLATSRGGVVVLRDTSAVDASCGATGRTARCDDPDGVIGLAVVVFPDGSTLDVVPSQATLDLRPQSLRLGVGSLEPLGALEDAKAPAIESLMGDVVREIQARLSTLPPAAQPMAQHLKEALERYATPASDDRYYVKELAGVGGKGCDAATSVGTLAKDVLNSFVDLLGKRTTEDAGEYGTFEEKLDTGLSDTSVWMLQPPDVETRVKALRPSADFLCTGTDSSRDGLAAIRRGATVTCSISDRQDVRFRWEFGPRDGRSQPYSYDGSEITFSPSALGSYRVTLVATDRNTHVTAVDRRFWEVFEPTSEPEPKPPPETPTSDAGTGTPAGDLRCYGVAEPAWYNECCTYGSHSFAIECGSGVSYAGGELFSDRADTWAGKGCTASTKTAARCGYTYCCPSGGVGQINPRPK